MARIGCGEAVGVKAAPSMVWENFQDAGIRVVLTGARMPRMNAVMERWVLTCRRELVDRMLIWN
ncbi:hypothetical protein ACFQ07_02720 [Actinomadura adrarensis]|uniref:Integrase catalytic domain-containing protein n=1 Tax=Actinomadura adrarensis TaxID=1819600 RepID=A0ABW3CC57_9ACTN